jgi:hypothetical protein
MTSMSGLPAVAVDELVPGLPLVHLEQQLAGLVVGHPVDADDVPDAPEQPEPAGLGVLADDRVELRRHRRVRRPDVHAPVGLLVGLAVHPARGVPAPGRVDRHPPSSRERRSAGIASSAACWSAKSVSPPTGGIVMPYRHVPAGGVLEAPVAVPVLGEQRRRLVGAPTDRDHVLTPLDRGDERVVAERTEVLREPLEVVVGQRLTGERQDVVLEPRRADLGDGVASSGADRSTPVTRAPHT